MSTLTNEEQQAIDKDSRTLRLIWMALSAAVPIYVVIGFVYTKMVGAVDPGLSGLPGYGKALMRYGVYALALVFLVLGVWRARTAGRPVFSTSFYGAIPASDATSDAGEVSGAAKMAMEIYRGRVITSFALCEAVALLGFISLVYSGDLVGMSVAGGCALAGMIYIVPRKDELVQMTGKLKDTVVA
jgi:hypothetical protein